VKKIFCDRNYKFKWRVQDMQNGMWKGSFVGLAVFVMLFLFFSPSSASDWEVSPSVQFIEEYNDNILFSRDEFELDDFVTYVQPRLEAIYSTERFHLSLDSGVSAEMYIDNDDLNTIDHDHRIALSHALSRNLSLTAGGYFRQDTTLEQELIEEGLLARREDRRKFGGNIGFDHALSSRFRLSGGWIRDYTEYPDAPDYVADSSSDILQLVPRYALSPQTSLFLNLAYIDTDYDYELNRSIKNYSIMPSFRHDFAEDFYVSGGAGYRYTEEEFGPLDEDTDGFVFSLLFHRDWKRSSMELLGSRDQYASLEGLSVERDRVTLRGTYRLSAKFRTALSATFRRNRYESIYADTDYFIISPNLSYDLTQNITLQGSVSYDKYAYDDDEDRDRERFRASLVLDLTWPRLWSGH
jgi:hypothetical protein